MIKVKFRSKEEVIASRYRDVRQFTAKVIAEFFSIELHEKNVIVKGMWSFFDAQGNKHKVNDIHFNFPSIHMAQIEYQFGDITTKNIYKYSDKRIEQIFPLILNQELAEDPEANFGLSGSDVELIS